MTRLRSWACDGTESPYPQTKMRFSRSRWGTPEVWTPHFLGQNYASCTLSLHPIQWRKTLTVLYICNELLAVSVLLKINLCWMLLERRWKSSHFSRERGRIIGCAILLLSNLGRTFVAGLPDSWLSLQLTDCYGLPWPLKLQSLRGGVVSQAGTPM